MKQRPRGDMGKFDIYLPACVLDWLLLIDSLGLYIIIYHALLWYIIPVGCGGDALSDFKERQVLYWPGVGTITYLDHFFKKNDIKRNRKQRTGTYRMKNTTEKKYWNVSV